MGCDCRSHLPYPHFSFVTLYPTKVAQMVLVPSQLWRKPFPPPSLNLDRQPVAAGKVQTHFWGTFEPCHCLNPTCLFGTWCIGPDNPQLTWSSMETHKSYAGPYLTWTHTVTNCGLPLMHSTFCYKLSCTLMRHKENFPWIPIFPFPSPNNDSKRTDSLPHRKVFCNNLLIWKPKTCNNPQTLAGIIPLLQNWPTILNPSFVHTHPSSNLSPIEPLLYHVVFMNCTVIPINEWNYVTIAMYVTP